MIHPASFDAVWCCTHKRQRVRAAALVAAIVGLATLIGTPTARAQTMTWGVFQENLDPSAANYPGNCWSQAMIDGTAINGLLLQGQLTQDQAQNALSTAINRGLCRNQPDD